MLLAARSPSPWGAPRSLGHFLGEGEPGPAVAHPDDVPRPERPPTWRRPETVLVRARMASAWVWTTKRGGRKACSRVSIAGPRRGGLHQGVGEVGDHLLVRHGLPLQQREHVLQAHAGEVLAPGWCAGRAGPLHPQHGDGARPGSRSPGPWPRCCPRPTAPGSGRRRPGARRRAGPPGRAARRPPPRSTGSPFLGVPSVPFCYLRGGESTGNKEGESMARAQDSSGARIAEVSFTRLQDPFAPATPSTCPA